ncbi:uncharacterized protein LOC125830025 [Solanum verrucosum]|uniref:uncharacterized protein LOC125830025 n=1 Tax=Solanum verrucosum TaxID=315347 RepID=UPI0020D08DB4|nr:uncharacterized protein LOC125830025 [Solanum verrucosum]
MEEEIVNGRVPPQGPQANQVPIDPPAMTNEKVRSDLLMMAQAVTTQAQANRGVETHMNPIVRTMASRWKYFVRMNPPIFLGSKYAPSLVSNPRDEISRYVTGVSDIVEEECRTTMLHEDLNISRLMVYAQSIEESKLKRKNREMKRTRFDEQGQRRFKKRAFKQDSSSTPRVNQEKGIGPPFSKPTCHNCGKKHHGKCLAGTSRCYGCGKNDHQVKDCPTLTAKGREVKQASLNGPDLDAPKKNHFCVLQGKEGK